MNPEIEKKIRKPRTYQLHDREDFTIIPEHPFYSISSSNPPQVFSRRLNKLIEIKQNPSAKTLFVTLHDEPGTHKSKIVPIARLLIQTFRPEIYSKNCRIYHIDKNPENNELENLTAIHPNPNSNR